MKKDSFMLLVLLTMILSAPPRSWWLIHYPVKLWAIEFFATYFAICYLQTKGIFLLPSDSTGMYRTIEDFERLYYKVGGVGMTGKYLNTKTLSHQFQGASHVSFRSGSY